MRWPAKNGWQRKFAWFPVQIGDVWVWLEPFEECPGEWGTHVRLPV